MKRRNMHLGAKPSVFKNAYILRQNLTEAEEILWSHLRERQMEGVKFRRQHPIKRYVPNFYGHSLKLAIELDGGYHNDPVQKFSDTDREENLSLEHITIIRFTNEEVIHSIDSVLSTIREIIIAMKSQKDKK